MEVRLYYRELLKLDFNRFNLYDVLIFGTYALELYLYFIN